MTRAQADISSATWDAARLLRHEQPLSDYRVWPPLARFHEELTPQDLCQAMEEVSQGTPLALYVHVPFCHSPCYHCDRHRVIAHDPQRIEHYFAGLLMEIRRAGQLPGARFRPITQLYLGGGTPAGLGDAQLTALIYELARHFKLLDTGDRDYVIETDPRQITLPQLSLLKGLGFNRLSFGVVDRDSRVQRAINRHQSDDDLKQTLAHAAALGFEQIDTEVVHGLPWQSEASLADTLSWLIALSPTSVRMRPYRHLPVRFQTQSHIAKAALPSPRESADMRVRAGEMLCQAGYQLIGSDTFVRPDSPLLSAFHRQKLQHNLQGYSICGPRDTLGLGASALTRAGNVYTQNLTSVSAWHSTTAQGDIPLQSSYLLMQDDQIRQALIQSLLCRHSVDFCAFDDTWHINSRAYFARELASLAEHVADGLVTLSAERLEITPCGQTVIGSICSIFDHYHNTNPTMTHSA